jgi:hypothetical protein
VVPRYKRRRHEDKVGRRLERVWRGIGFLRMVSTGLFGTPPICLTRGWGTDLCQFIMDCGDGSLCFFRLDR